MLDLELQESHSKDRAAHTEEVIPLLTSSMKVCMNGSHNTVENNKTVSMEVEDIDLEQQRVHDFFYKPFFIDRFGGYTLIFL